MAKTPNLRSLLLGRMEEWKEKDPRQWAHEKVLRCECHCGTHYLKYKQKIEQCLETYKPYLPLVFTISDTDLVPGNFYAEIINRKEFVGMCSECCWAIVQSYNFTDKVMYERYFGNRGIPWKSICYN